MPSALRERPIARLTLGGSVIESRPAISALFTSPPFSYIYNYRRHNTVQQLPMDESAVSKKSMAQGIHRSQSTAVPNRIFSFQLLQWPSNFSYSATRRRRLSPRVFSYLYNFFNSKREKPWPRYSVPLLTVCFWYIRELILHPLRKFNFTRASKSKSIVSQQNALAGLGAVKTLEKALHKSFPSSRSILFLVSKE